MKPGFAVWLCTSRCNLNCLHCYVRGRFSGPELSFDDAVRMAEDLLEWGLDYVSITGGEPFTRPDMLNLIQTFVDMGLEVSVNTNGLLLDRRTVKVLRGAECFVFLSMDGVCRESHEAVRGPGTWSRVLDAAHRLADEDVSFAVVYALNSRNFHEAGEIPFLAESLGAVYVAVIPLIPSGAAHRPVGLVPNPGQVFKGLRMFEESMDEIGFTGAVWCTPFAHAIVRSRRVYVSGCTNAMDISPSGDVLLCDTLDFTFSNVLRDGVEEGWRRLVGSRLYRDAFVSRCPEECRDCPAFNLCGGGCAARAYLTYGTFSKPDPMCPFLKKPLHSRRIRGGGSARVHPEL